MSPAANETIWRAKVHARLHDPIEKALVLMRDPAGHEGGTVRALHDALFTDGVSDDIRALVRKADHWASAADRPQFPRDAKDGRYARWTQVRFDQEPVIRHPVSAEALNLGERGNLTTTHVANIRAVSEIHLRHLCDQPGNDDPATIWRRRALALWRFGPEVPRDLDAALEVGLGELWRLLPADTRVPDHTIWNHLDLVAAFATAFVADPQHECSLLSLSIGPVQQFISQARSTSDLWAGSHLLARMSWEAMRVVCDAYGPEAILFPSLRAVPQVDLWLLNECGLAEDLFATASWRKGTGSDTNPLFSATLPNRFTALVPSGAVAELAARVVAHVRDWVKLQARTAWSEILAELALDTSHGAPGFKQIDEQLEGFPEISWAATPWSAYTLASPAAEPTDLNIKPLTDALSAFYPEDGPAPGYLGSSAWQAVSGTVSLRDNTTFYRPNAGVLYPAIQELTERSLAATKATRAFDALPQSGFRCSLTAEVEWLTDDRGQLDTAPGQRSDTVWARLAEQRPAWVRKGEHLGALAALKRLWPKMFVDQLRGQGLGDFSRFVVSTHTMAISAGLADLLERGADIPADLANDINGLERVALPARLARAAGKRADQIARLPALLESTNDESDDNQSSARRRLRAIGLKADAYYALILMDGDHMGRWLSGDDAYQPQQHQTFHPRLTRSLEAHLGPEVTRAYLHAPRPLSPGRVAAISAALNDFAGVVARHVIEGAFYGRLLYAGGDDLLAMVPVSQLTEIIQALRASYSGNAVPEPIEGMELGRGFAYLRSRIHTLMGTRASASIGAVVAHHKAPLSRVLQELRATEQRAKQLRNAFSITIAKRSGAALSFTSSFGADDTVDGIGLLNAVRRRLAGNADASRRAVYHSLEWLAELPALELLDAGSAADGGAAAMQELLAGSLHYQFVRQGLEAHDDRTLSASLAQACPKGSAQQIRAWLGELLAVAEFLAREERAQ